jgi:hypothetical protein
MAKKIIRIKRNDLVTKELSSWNFVIFLTLSLMLLIIVVSALRSVSTDLRSRAGLACPSLSLPNANSCLSGWKYTDNVNGCPGFVCENK